METKEKIIGYKAVYFDPQREEDGTRIIIEDCGHWHRTYKSSLRCGEKIIGECFDIIRKRDEDD